MTRDRDLTGLERTMGGVLAAGTRVSTIFLACGLAAVFAFGGTALPGVLLTIGLSILMATPVARVVVSVVDYVRQHDWLYALYTGIVLALLVGSVVAAVLGG